MCVSRKFCLGMVLAPAKNRLLAIVFVSTYSIYTCNYINAVMVCINLSPIVGACGAYYNTIISYFKETCCYNFHWNYEHVRLLLVPHSSPVQLEPLYPYIQTKSTSIHTKYGSLSFFLNNIRLSKVDLDVTSAKYW